MRFGTKSSRKKRAKTTFLGSDPNPDLAEFVSNAERINTDVLEKVYHVDYPFHPVTNTECKSNQNCKMNPNCLGHLRPKKLIGVFAEEPKLLQDLGVNPATYWRDPFMIPLRQRVGLVNLGATCWMNSLIQSLFINVRFRAGLYDFDASAEADNAHSIIFQLQKLFVQLQTCNRSYIKPTGFASCLEINTGVQQDAQEFNKLLMSYLEDKFADSDGLSRTLVQDLFQGNMVYQTECSHCHSKSRVGSMFYEMELQIKGSGSLEECLDKYFEDEVLAGDDQY